MNSKLKSPLGMKPQGVGPKIFRNAMPFLLTGILAAIFFPELSTLPIKQTSLLKTPGLVMLITGVLMYFMSMVQFLRDFPKGKLITNGVYRISRNPLYTSWILLILPGLSLLCNNWIFLLASISMYISLIILIKTEEESLRTAFGKEYEDYCARVRRVL